MVEKIVDAEAFAEVTHVSRETLDKLVVYCHLLEKWQSKINLVGKNTQPTMWHRHFFDSAQLWPLIEKSISGLTGPSGDNPTPLSLVDLGSGAGFPGLVLAIMAADAAPSLRVHVIESDQRKCVFLREVARVTEIKVTLHPSRIEDMAPFPAHIITARACAPLDRLIPYAYRFWGPETRAFFLKGQDVEKERVQATKSWGMVIKVVPSLTDASGSLLCVKEVRRV